MAIWSLAPVVVGFTGSLGVLLICRLALAVGFMLLTPIYDAFGWRVLFFLTGGVGLIVIVPLYMIKLCPESEAPFRPAPEKEGMRLRLRLADLGGPAFLLLLFSYITQGMLFWGITLWIPLAVRSLGFTGFSQAVASALPYGAAVVLAVPMTLISDRTGKRILVAALGLLFPGLLMACLPLLDSGAAKLTLITVALGYCGRAGPRDGTGRKSLNSWAYGA